MNDQEIQEVRESFGRCTLKGDLIDRFYEIFLESHPDIKPRFANTDFTKQKELLRKGINIAILFGNDKVLGRKGIEKLRESHKRTKLNVSPSLYIYWKKSLLQAVSEYDYQYNRELETTWEKLIEKTITYIAEGYEDN